MSLTQERLRTFTASQALLQVDLKAIEHNVRLIRKLSALKVIPVLKSQAYGLGLMEIARYLSEHLSDEGGIPYIAVRDIEEALSLSKGPPQLNFKVLVLMTEKNRDMIATALKSGIGLTVYDKDIAKLVLEGYQQLSKQSQGIRPHLHLKLDTGMNRFGFKPNELRELLEDDGFRPLLRYIDTVYTHLIDGEDIQLTLSQLITFESMYDELLSKTKGYPQKHAFSSSSLLRYLEEGNAYSRGYEMCRVGLLIYGIAPSQTTAHIRREMGFKGSLTLKVKPLTLKEVRRSEHLGYGREVSVPPDVQRVAILPIGYNVLPRSISGKLRFNCEAPDGKRYSLRQLGKICMDCTIVEYPEDLPPETYLTLSSKDIEEIAFSSDTVPHELVIRLGKGIRDKVFIY